MAVRLTREAHELVHRLGRSLQVALRHAPLKLGSSRPRLGLSHCVVRVVLVGGIRESASSRGASRTLGIDSDVKVVARLYPSVCNCREEACRAQRVCSGHPSRTTAASDAILGRCCRPRCESRVQVKRVDVRWGRPCGRGRCAGRVRLCGVCVQLRPRCNSTVPGFEEGQGSIDARAPRSVGAFGCEGLERCQGILRLARQQSRRGLGKRIGRGRRQQQRTLLRHTAAAQGTRHGYRHQAALTQQAVQRRRRRWHSFQQSRGGVTGCVGSPLRLRVAGGAAAHSKDCVGALQAERCRMVQR